MEAPVARSVPSDVVKRGGRVVFTPLHLENIYTHFEWNNDPELNRLDSELPFERESFQDFKVRFERLLLESIPGTRDFEIHTNEGALIGIAFLAELSEHSRHCSVGVTIGDKKYWRKGYGRESLALLLAYCFGDLGMHRVSTETFIYNEAWRHLVRSLGFKREGVKREYLMRDGRFWDKELYAMLEDEYREGPASGFFDTAKEVTS